MPILAPLALRPVSRNIDHNTKVMEVLIDCLRAIQKVRQEEIQTYPILATREGGEEGNVDVT